MQIFTDYALLSMLIGLIVEEGQSYGHGTVIFPKNIPDLEFNRDVWEDDDGDIWPTFVFLSASSPEHQEVVKDFSALLDSHNAPERCNGNDEVGPGNCADFWETVRDNADQKYPTNDAKYKRIASIIKQYKAN